MADDASKYDYDLFVIGAGSGGVRAARMAAQYGARVAIAESYRVGGTCVIRGCVPKKLFVYASHFADDFEDAAGFGWTAPAPTFSWPQLVANKDQEIDRLNQIYIRNLENSGVEVFETRAQLKDPHTIHLDEPDKDLTAAVILIATGAWPHLPDDVPGIAHAITSNEAFHLEALPKHITIVGGGYIAVEFAGIFNGLGVDTAVLYRGEEILRGFDDDLRARLHQEMAKKGIDVRVQAHVTAIEKTGDGFHAALQEGGTIETGLVMYATGRSPNTVGLGLEGAGVNLDPDTGAIKVDDFSRTSQGHIYAVGDVTDRNQLTPVAIREGAAFAETVFNDKPSAVDHTFIPTAVFSHPEIGTVGYTEAEARAQFGEIDIYKSAFKPMKHTLSGRDTQAFMKLVVDAKSQRVLGCHLLGPDSGEMAQLLGIAVKMGATKQDFDETVAVHPTGAEELVTMREKWTPTPKTAD